MWSVTPTVFPGTQTAGPVTRVRTQQIRKFDLATLNRTKDDYLGGMRMPPSTRMVSAFM